MRLLFTFAGGAGHADPLVPIAGAARLAGHTVAFAGRSSVVAGLPARGFTAFGDSTGSAEVPQPIGPLLEPSAEREDRVLREAYAGRFARTRAAAVLALCADWSPDVVVCDETDFGSMIAAERLGLPHATVLVIAAGSLVRAEIVAEPLNALRAEHGLPPDPELAMLSRHLVLSPCPPSFRDPAFPLPPTAHSLRPETLAPRARHTRPAVYFTLGTAFNVESGDLFARVLAGLRDLPVDVIVTVGNQVDPGVLGPQPPNVQIERHLPHAAVLPRCDLVVSHGGSGTVIAALAAGLPSVVIPMGGDQPQNAARCEALGVGVALDAVRATPEEVGDAARAVLGDPSYREAAGRIREEIAALPGPATAVSLLEGLVARSRRARG